MFVCVCRAVTDKEVEASIEAGAHTVEAVTAKCQAGGDCGACHNMIEDMIEAKTGCPSKRRLQVVRAA